MTLQRPDGLWEDEFHPHQMDSLGNAAWCFWTHYLLSRDRDFLEKAYVQFVKGVRWTQRNRSQLKTEAFRSRGVYGLLPAGVGDGGAPLGFNYHHNLWALFGQKLTVEAARELGRTDDLKWMNEEFADYRQSIHDSLRANFIRYPDGSGRNPVSPGDYFTTSLWGSLVGYWPDGQWADTPEFKQTLAWFESRRFDGLPTHIGYADTWPWMNYDLAQYYLAAGQREKALDMFYAILNHAWPTRAWPEEQHLPSRVSFGDMPHTWANAGTVMMIRNLLAREQGGALHLASGVPAAWMGHGDKVSLRRAPTAFGELTYHMQSEANQNQAVAEIQLAQAGVPIRLHLCHPQAKRLHSAMVDGKSAAIRNNVVELISSGTRLKIIGKFA
jgi:hypothetical protein